MPFLSGIWGKIVAAGSIVAALLVACAKLISIGRNEQIQKDMKGQLDDANLRTQNDERVAAATPADRDELRSKWTR